MAHADWCDLILNHERCNCVGHAPLSRKQPAPPSAPGLVQWANRLSDAATNLRLSPDAETIEWAAKQAEDAAAALRAAEQDVARLDWLEANWVQYGALPIDYFMDQKCDIRAAIDAAQREEGNE
jgi:hypothetical protein